MDQITEVFWSKQVHKEIQRLPQAIILKFHAWVATVKLLGIRETRKNIGFHDEPLKGKRQGQRSVRLNRSYRAIYNERSDGRIQYLEILEVNKHEY